MRLPRTELYRALWMAAVIVAVGLLLRFPACGQQGPGLPAVTPSGINFPVENPPEPVASATVTKVGNPGARTMYYWIVSEGTLGQSAPAGPFELDFAPNNYTASPASGASLNWQPANGATSYDILRSDKAVPPQGACGCAVTTGVTGTSYTDTSESRSAYTVNASNPAGIAITLANQSKGFNASELRCLSPTGVNLGAVCGLGANGQGTGTGSTGLTTLITPPTTGTYAILYPSTVTMYSGTQGKVTALASGSALINRTHSCGLCDWDVWANWTGFSLPAYITAANVTAVYAVQSSQENFQLGIPEMAAGQGTPSFNAAINFSGSSWRLPSPGNGQTSVLLASGGAAASFNFATTSISADNASSVGATANDQWNIGAVALVVFYSGSQVAQSTGVGVQSPLFVNAATNILGIGQVSSTTDGYLSAAQYNAMAGAAQMQMVAGTVDPNPNSTICQSITVATQTLTFSFPAGIVGCTVSTNLPSGGLADFWYQTTGWSGNTLSVKRVCSNNDAGQEGKFQTTTQPIAICTGN